MHRTNIYKMLDRVLRLCCVPNILLYLGQYGILILIKQKSGKRWPFGNLIEKIFLLVDGWSVFCPSKVRWCLTISRETGKDIWQISSGQGGVTSRVNTHKMPSEVDEKYFSNLEREIFQEKSFTLPQLQWLTVYILILKCKLSYLISWVGEVF